MENATNTTKKTRREPRMPKVATTNEGLIAGIDAVRATKAEFENAWKVYSAAAALVQELLEEHGRPRPDYNGAPVSNLPPDPQPLAYRRAVAAANRAERSQSKAWDRLVLAAGAMLKIPVDAAADILLKQKVFAWAHGTTDTTKLYFECDLAHALSAIQRDVGGLNGGGSTPAADPDAQLYLNWEAECLHLIDAMERAEEEPEADRLYDHAAALDELICQHPGRGQTAADVKLRRLLCSTWGLPSGAFGADWEAAARSALAATGNAVDTAPFDPVKALRRLRSVEVEVTGDGFSFPKGCRDAAPYLLAALTVEQGAQILALAKMEALVDEYEAIGGRVTWCCAAGQSGLHLLFPRSLDRKREDEITAALLDPEAEDVVKQVLKMTDRVAVTEDPAPEPIDLANEQKAVIGADAVADRWITVRAERAAENIPLQSTISA